MTKKKKKTIEERLADILITEAGNIEEATQFLMVKDKLKSLISDIVSEIVNSPNPKQQAKNLGLYGNE